MPSATKQQVQPEAHFYMPVPDRGQMVVFYPAGNVSTANRHMAYINKVSRNNIEVLLSGRLFEGVRHVTDPKLETNPNAKAFGAWDFTDRDKKLDLLAEKVRLLDSKVDTVFDLLAESKVNKAPNTK